MLPQSRPFALSLTWSPPVRRITWPTREYAAAGALLGTVAGLAAAARHDLAAGFVLLLFLPPALALAGALAGLFAARHGWRYAAPLAGALLGSTLLPLHDPHGWVIGAALGGLLHGARLHSFDRAVRYAALGALLGALAWGLCAVYVTGLVTLGAGAG